MTTRVVRHALRLVAAIVVLAVARPARCEVTISLSLDRSEATLADSMVLSVSVSGAHGDAARPAIQGLEDFHVRPAGTSTRVEIVNGQYSAGTNFTYLVQPKKAGSFRVGPAELTVGGATYRSNVAAVAVGQPAASPDGDRGPVFLVAALAPARVYVDQQALYTLKLYRSANIADVSVDVPEVDGVAFSKLGEPREYQGVYQGRPYQVIEVRYLVVPHKAGNRALAPTRMELTVFTQQSRSRRGIFDDPFFGGRSSGRSLALTSEALTLQVLPLPEAGRPADFGGLTGSFTLEATVEPRELKAGESVTLTAIVRGRGNARRIPELPLPRLDGLKIYADQPAVKEEQDGDGVIASKTMKWALVPERPGSYEIPPLALSYFDTTAGRYRTLKTVGATLSVLPAGAEHAAPAPARPTGGAAPNSPAQPRRAVAELGNDILPIHTGKSEPNSGAAALPGRALLWLLITGPPAAFFLTVGGALLRRKSGSLAAALSVKKAAAGFTRTCRRDGVTADELLQALHDYLSRRLGIPRGSLTADDAAGLLRSRGVDAGTLEELHGVWRRIEDAIYTGKGRETSDAGEALAALVARIERALR